MVRGARRAVGGERREWQREQPLSGRRRAPSLFFRLLPHPRQARPPLNRPSIERGLADWGRPARLLLRKPQCTRCSRGRTCRSARPPPPRPTAAGPAEARPRVDPPPAPPSVTSGTRTPCPPSQGGGARSRPAWFAVFLETPCFRCPYARVGEGRAHGSLSLVPNNTKKTRGRSVAPRPFHRTLLPWARPPRTPAPRPRPLPRPAGRQQWAPRRPTRWPTRRPRLMHQPPSPHLRTWSATKTPFGEQGAMDGGMRHFVFIERGGQREMPGFLFFFQRSRSFFFPCRILTPPPLPTRQTTHPGRKSRRPPPWSAASSPCPPWKPSTRTPGPPGPSSSPRSGAWLRRTPPCAARGGTATVSTGPSSSRTRKGASPGATQPNVTGS